MHRKIIILTSFEIKTVSLFITVLTFLISGSPAYSQWWTQQNSGTGSKTTAIQFADNNTGFFVTQDSPTMGSIYKSTNGGSSWLPLSFHPGALNSVYLINSNTGFITGNNGYAKTTNGGLNFDGVYTPNIHHMDVHFVDNNTGYMISVGQIMPQNAPLLYSTTNAGLNWSTLNLPYTDIFYSIHFPSPSIGFACGENGRIIKSTTGWGSVPSGTTQTLYSIFFTDSQTGYTAGGNSTLLNTTNEGANWSALSVGTPNLSLNAVYFTDLNTGYVCGSGGYIFKTTDAGASWLTLNSGVTAGLNNIWFINQFTGFVCGDNGIILKTTTGGVNAIEKIGNNIPSGFSLTQNRPNPFNPGTTIHFELPENSFVKLTVFDITGKEIKELINANMHAGYHEVNFDASALASGVYFYKLAASEEKLSGSVKFSEVKKMILLK
jgi:photosystem II stability/assembly factor-like uncharacterized protein